MSSALLPPKLQQAASLASPPHKHLYRFFHEYFVTHIPSTSLHPDSRASSGPGHQLPRSASKPHDSKSGPSPAPLTGPHRDTTVVRIPIRSAKHHFGASVSRGTRPYNEDAFQAGVVSIPAFTKRCPQSVSRAPAGSVLEKYREQQRKEQAEKAKRRAAKTDTNPEEDDGMTREDTETGDPQVFYFGVFDGHGGAQCSGYLSKALHGGIEETAKLYNLQSTLRPPSDPPPASTHSTSSAASSTAKSDSATNHALPLLQSYKANIGGYFRRFNPPLLTTNFSTNTTTSTPANSPSSPTTQPSISQVLTHAFLSTDLNFILTQQRLAATSTSCSAHPSDDRPINDLDSRNASWNNPPSSLSPPQTAPFKGGSTASIALISTPTPTPFWNPSTTATLAIAHVGDTRILLSRVDTGAAHPCTSTHHPSSPSEAARLRRWAPTSFDSFGEERILGSLANTRSFGDVGSKSLGVSAEPELQLLDLGASEYAFMVLVSDGVTAAMTDQEIVDLVKEARTPELAAREVTAFAVDVTGAESDGADNCTCLVVRLGGWERRSEGGGGGLGTKEAREWRRREATEGGGRSMR